MAETTISCYQLLLLLKQRNLIDKDIDIDELINNFYATISRPDEIMGYGLYGQNIGLFKIIHEDVDKIRCCICYINIPYNFNEVERHIRSEKHISKTLLLIKKNSHINNDDNIL